MNRISIIVWILRVVYISISAYIVSKTATKVDLMEYGFLTTFMILMSYLVGVIYTIGCNDGKTYINNKKKKNETKSN